MNKIYLFLLSFCFAPGLYAQQSPGGVSTNLSLWLKADAASTLTTSGGNLTAWGYSNNGNTFTSPAGSQPTVTSSALNFLPAVSFSGAQYMSGPSGPGGAPIPALSLAYSVFAVWSSNTAIGGPNQRVWVERPASNAYDNNFDGAALWIYANGSQYGDQPEISPFTTGLGLNYAPGTSYISQLNFLAQNTNDLELIDQSNLNTGPVVVSTDPAGQALTNRKLSDAANIIGARSTVAGDEPFNGNLSELIVYSGPVSGTQRNQIFSYLSMKYGIPIKTNLVSSAGTTIWDATANSAYNNNVFGIGLDNATGLAVNQSNSINTGSGNGTGKSGALNIVLSAPAPLSTDQSFLTIGTDGAALTEETANVPAAAAGSKRLTRLFKVQQTGSVGNVNLAVDLTGVTVSGNLSTPTDFRLIVNPSGDGTFATAGTGFYTPTISGNIATFTGVNLPTGSVFTVITQAAPATPLPVNWLSFTADNSGNNVTLNWTVAANQNGKEYQVQRSVNGGAFETVGVVANVPSIASYNYIDGHVPAGQLNYRIYEVDLDGNGIYSKVLSLSVNSVAFSMTVLNNPVVNNSDAGLLVSTDVAGLATVELWSPSGARISTRQQSLVAGSSNKISIPLSGLPAQTYIVRVTLNNTVRTMQIVKL